MLASSTESFYCSRNRILFYHSFTHWKFLRHLCRFCTPSCALKLLDFLIKSQIKEVSASARAGKETILFIIHIIWLKDFERKCLWKNRSKGKSVVDMLEQEIEHNEDWIIPHNWRIGRRGGGCSVEILKSIHFDDIHDLIKLLVA